MPGSNQSVFKKFLKGGFISALSASALAFSIMIILAKPIDYNFIIIVFLLSSIVYFSDYITGLKTKMIYLVIDAVAIAVCLYLTLRSSTIYATSFVVIFLILGALYPVILKNITKRVVGFKDIYISVCWNLLIPFFLIFHQYHFTFIVVCLMLLVFSRDLVNSSYCDLKDIANDRQKGLNTFAVYFGKDILFKILFWVNLVSCILIIVFVVQKIFSPVNMFIIVPVLITTFLISYSKTVQKYPSFNVDFEYFIWAGLLFLVK